MHALNSRNDSPANELYYNLFGQLRRRLIARTEMQFGRSRRFIGIADASEVWNFAFAREFVKPLRITALTDFQRSVYEDFDKIAGLAVLLNPLANTVAIEAVGTNKRG